MTTLKKAKVETLSNGLKWHWADETVTLVDSAEIPEEIREAAMLHGLKQKLSDSYSGADTVLAAKQAFEATLDSLMKGLWNAGRSSTGGVWVEALAKAAAVTLEEALEKWNSLDDEQKKDLKKNPQVKQAKAEIELERAKAKAEGSELDLDSI